MRRLEAYSFLTVIFASPLSFFCFTQTCDSVPVRLMRPTEKNKSLIVIQVLVFLSSIARPTWRMLEVYSN